ncbi:hypothetical protein KBG23_00305 [Candidatus Dojkabacteria bacterium]|nr:hypothetical protein [Candidatus Dojkabacteria bacterium]
MTPSENADTQGLVNDAEQDVAEPKKQGHVTLVSADGTVIDKFETSTITNSSRITRSEDYPEFEFQPVDTIKNQTDPELLQHWTVKGPYAKKVATVYKPGTKQNTEARKKHLEGMDRESVETIQYDENTKARRIAERQNFIEYRKKMRDMSSFDKDLRSGRELNEQEVKLLLENHLANNTEYQEHKSNIQRMDKKYREKYMSNLDEEATKSFKSKLRDKEGVYTSKNIDIDEMKILKDAEKQRREQKIQEVQKAWQKHRTYLDESRKKTKRDTRPEAEEFKKAFEDKHKIPYSLEAAQREQAKEGELAAVRRERDLYREKIAALENLFTGKKKEKEKDNKSDKTIKDSTPPPQPKQPVSPTSPTTPISGKAEAKGEWKEYKEDEKVVRERERAKAEQEKQRQKRKLTVTKVIGTLFGLGTTVAGGLAVGVPVAMIAAVTSMTAQEIKEFAPQRMFTLKEQIAKETNDKKKAHLEKRYNRWNKIHKVLSSNFATHAISFLSFGAIGASVGSLVSHVFMGGQGLVGIAQAKKAAEVAAAAKVATIK